ADAREVVLVSLNDTDRHRRDARRSVGHWIEPTARATPARAAALLLGASPAHPIGHRLLGRRLQHPPEHVVTMAIGDDEREPELAARATVNASLCMPGPGRGIDPLERPPAAPVP